MYFRKTALCLAISLLAGASVFSQKTLNALKRNGMEVKWSRDGEYLEFELKAPSEGWLAIGFNQHDQLSGTHLIMVHQNKEGVFALSDRYIKAPGEHVSVKELGGQAHAQLIHAERKNGQTTALLKVRLKAKDQWHQHLEAGKKYHLLMAYSQSDDLYHHSLFRTSVQFSFD